MVEHKTRTTLHLLLPAETIGMHIVDTHHKKNSTSNIPQSNLSANITNFLLINHLVDKEADKHYKLL